MNDAAIESIDRQIEYARHFFLGRLHCCVGPPIGIKKGAQL